MKLTYSVGVAESDCVTHIVAVEFTQLLLSSATNRKWLTSLAVGMDYDGSQSPSKE